MYPYHRSALPSSSSDPSFPGIFRFRSRPYGWRITSYSTGMEWWGEISRISDVSQWFIYRCANRHKLKTCVIVWFFRSSGCVGNLKCVCVILLLYGLIFRSIPAFYLYALGIVYKHRWAEISTGVFKISCLKICKINFILYFWSVLAFLCPSGIGNKREPGVNPGQAPLLWASLQRPDNTSATVVYTSDGKASGLEQVRRPAIQAIVCAFADSEPDTCTYILLYC